jgi:hypothetical protein
VVLKRYLPYPPPQFTRRENLFSSHGEREGEALAALLLEGATRAPLTENNAWNIGYMTGCLFWLDSNTGSFIFIGLDNDSV